VRTLGCGRSQYDRRVTTPLRIRQAARAVVMDPDRRVLLVHFDFDVELNDGRLWDGLWACPGGGLDPGEAIDAGLRRELHEELGLEVDDVGSPIWVKEHHFPMTRWDGQHDTYFLVRVDAAFEPRPLFSEAELRAEHVDGMLWWTYADLVRAQASYDAGDTDDPHFAVLSPRRLGHLIADLVEHGPPAEPLDVGPR
jgi:8-oxo-dGTP diphosphatase